MTPSEELAIITECLEEHKAEDIVSVDLKGSSPFADYAVIATCPNPRALGALQELVEDALAENEVVVKVKEGEPDSGWVIVQGEDVIVHLMLAGNRRMLDLETLLEQLKQRNSPRD